MKSTELTLRRTRTKEEEEEVETEDGREVQGELLGLFSDNLMSEEPAAISKSLAYSSKNVNIGVPFLQVYILLLYNSF